MLTAAPGQTDAYLAAVEANRPLVRADLAAARFRKQFAHRAALLALAADSTFGARRALFLIRGYVKRTDKATRRPEQVKP